MVSGLVLMQLVLVKLKFGDLNSCVVPWIHNVIILIEFLTLVTFTEFTRLAQIKNLSENFYTIYAFSNDL